MGCDYYTNLAIVIHYRLNDIVFKKIFDGPYRQCHWLNKPPDNDSDDDDQTQDIKWNIHMQNKIKSERKVKILFENFEWIKKSYETKYSNNVLKWAPKDCQILKVYRSVYAWERE